MKIKNSVIFITGANRGIGLAFAREAIARGASKVYAGMRNVDGFNEPGLTPIKVDVTDSKSVGAAARAAPDVTLLINNAGIADLTQDPLAGSFEEQCRRLFETNYYGIMRTTQAFVNTFPTDGTGGIINVLSDATWRVLPDLTAYSATKAAAWNYTNNVREFLKERNIQVLGLHVGFVDTDLTKRLNVPKSSPVDVVRRSYDALEAGQKEILADENTKELKRTLSADVAAYLDPSVLS